MHAVAPIAQAREEVAPLGRVLQRHVRVGVRVGGRLVVRVGVRDGVRVGVRDGVRVGVRVRVEMYACRSM